MSLGDDRFYEEIRQREKAAHKANGDVSNVSVNQIVVIVFVITAVISALITCNNPNERADNIRRYQRMENERAVKEHFEREYPFAPNEAIDRSTKRIVDEWDKAK